MKIIKTIIAAMACALSLTACASKTTTDSDAGQPQNENEMKSVIIYFTHSGNTELAAKEVADVTRARMIRLMPDSPIHQKMWIGSMSSLAAPRNISINLSDLSLNPLMSILLTLTRFSSVSQSGGMKNLPSSAHCLTTTIPNSKARCCIRSAPPTKVRCQKPMPL